VLFTQAPGERSLIPGRYWLVLGAALWAVANAGQPPAPPPPPPAPPESSSPDVPDAEFIEFLGADDHGDTEWWEFLKKAPPGADDPPAAPPGARQ
jgi:hypothetical protein